MKASDKICVAPHQIFDYDLDTQEVGHNGAEEYIRKASLLKWINEARAIPHENAITRDLAFQEVVNKINGM